MAFTWIQGGKNTVNPGKSVQVVLTSNPVQGNVVCIGIGFSVVGGLPGTVTVQDSAGNLYTQTPLSPSTITNNNVAYLFYLIAGPTATKTITASWPTTSIPGVIHADEFDSDAEGFIAFDKDAEDFNASSSTNISTPSITPTSAGELLYAFAANDNSINSPTPGGTLGIWTGSGGGVSAFGSLPEYDLSSAVGASAVQMTQTPTGTYTAMAMAFAEGQDSVIVGTGLTVVVG